MILKIGVRNLEKGKIEEWIFYDNITELRTGLCTYEDMKKFSSPSDIILNNVHILGTDRDIESKFTNILFTNASGEQVTIYTECDVYLLNDNGKTVEHIN